MERYEVRVKFDEIRNLSEAGEYRHAMDIADTIDWDRVRNIGMLTVAGEVYERCRYYEDCRAIYERIYEIQPQSRINVYKLANVSVKLKDFDSANSYLKEYREIAPYDPNVLVLTYKIRKGQGAELPELIRILEQLKAKDYHEKWAYELAVMYAEAGEREKCANECDNIFLWFGEGRYVYKALKLKSFFRTLTTAQEQYMNAVSHKPAGAEETVRKAAETADETKEKQSRFMELQQEAAGADADSPAGQETLRDLEQARAEAIDASREAKAAELLNEARSEEEQEDAAAAETEDQEMLGETKFPTFHLPVMEKIKAPEWRTSMPEPDRSENVPGMEFIDESAGQADTAEMYPETEGYAEETENAEMFSELPEDTLSDPERYADELPEDTLPESEQYAEERQADDLSEQDVPQEADLPRYQTMEELLSHADDMKPDDLANALARALSGGQDADRSQEKPEKGTHSPRSLQNVISRIWTRSAARKAEEHSIYSSDPELDDVDNIDMSSVSPSRYDTLNLQKDLANSINHILNATDKAEIDKTIAVMDRRMQKTNISRYAETSAAEEEAAADTRQSGISDIVKQSMETPDAEEFTRKKEKLFNTLEDEVNGQIRMIMETETEDEDIPGQISVEEYMQEQEQAQLEEAKKHAIRIAGDYMEQVTKAVPYIAEEEAKTYLADSQKELLEQTRKLMESRNPDPEEIDAVMKSLMMMTAYANEKASDPHDASVIDAAVEAKAEMAAEKTKVHAPEKVPELIEVPDIPEPVAPMETIDVSELSDISETLDIPETAEVPEIMEMPEEPKMPETMDVPETEEVETMNVPEEPEMPEAEETPAPAKAAAVAAASAAAAAVAVSAAAKASEAAEAPAMAEVPEAAEAPKTVEVPETAEMPAAKGSSKSTGLTKNLTEEFSGLFRDAPKKSDTAAMENILEASIQTAAADKLAEAVSEKTISEETIPEVSEETREMIHENKEKLMDSIADIVPREVEDLDKEEAKTQVVPMNDEQWEIMDYFMNVPEIEKQIAEFIEQQHRKFTNIVICGKSGSGRASLALRLYKSIRVNNPDLPNQTLKVDADSLNKKSVLKVYEKVGKGLILIEHAGMLSSVAVSELIQAMHNTKNSIYTILVSDQGKMERLFEKHPDLAPLFDYTFVIPQYNLDQFVDFGKNYALSYGYVIDDIAQLAFYSAISAKKTKNRLVTLQDVKSIINEAILNNESHSNRLFRGLGSKTKDRDGNIILKERDFS